MRCYLLIQSDVTDENPTGRQFYKVFKEVTILPETVELHKAKKTAARRKAQVDTEEWMAQADEIVEAAGFEIRQPGCSACLAMNDDKIPAGKYSVSTSNRNFEGRQGPGSRTILASPYVAAAAAITGKITDPREFMK